MRPNTQILEASTNGPLISDKDIEVSGGGKCSLSNTWCCDNCMPMSEDELRPLPYTMHENQLIMNHRPK